MKRAVFLCFTLFLIALASSAYVYQASGDPLNTAWYVTDAAGLPLDGVLITVYYSKSKNSDFTAMPADITEDKVARIYQNPIITGYWNDEHDHGVAAADLQVKGVSSYYFYLELNGSQVWYWPTMASIKPGDPRWNPDTSSSSPSGYVASGNGLGNGVSTAFPAPAPPALAVPESPLGSMATLAASFAALGTLVSIKKRPKRT